MAGYGSIKMKRKEWDDVSDDFSDFSLSSPARKIRRLDSELPPIMEEDEREMPAVGGFGQSGVAAPVTEGVPVNKERAIVLFNPINTPLFHSPSDDVSVSLHPDIVSSLKNTWWGQHNRLRLEDSAVQDDENSEAEKRNLAVVPWAPTQFQQALSAQCKPEEKAPQMMEAEAEAEEMEATGMEMETDEVIEFGGYSSSGLRRGEAQALPLWQQQQQQHCINPYSLVPITPQLPQNTSTPIVWYP